MGEGGVKNPEKMPTSFMDGPLDKPLDFLGVNFGQLHSFIDCHMFERFAIHCSAFEIYSLFGLDTEHGLRTGYFRPKYHDISAPAAPILEQ